MHRGKRKVADDHGKNDMSSDDQLLEDDSDELTDLMSIDDSIDPVTDANIVRPDFIDKVYGVLSSDAQRGDGELQRIDVNRAYLRKQLSISECMAVEERIIAAGYRILDNEDETESKKEDTTEPKQRYRYLNETEERDLGRRIQLALLLPEDTSSLDPVYIDRVRKDAERARTTFVASNIRYVEQIARRMGQHRHLSLEDVTQEGFIGLLKAADLYDPERGFRFKTYATWWIEQRMRRAIADSDRTVRLPVHVHEKVSRIKRAKKKLTQSRGHPPTMNELAIAVGIEPEKLMTLLWRVQATDCAEGDKTIGEDASLLSYVVDSAESAFDLILYQELQERIRLVLATLTPREERIMRMRFGIDLDQDYTLDNIGKHYDLTRERIRQIEAKAFNKLRRPSRRDLLNDFLDY